MTLLGGGSREREGPLQREALGGEPAQYRGYTCYLGVHCLALTPRAPLGVTMGRWVGGAARGGGMEPGAGAIEAVDQGLWPSGCYLSPLLRWFGLAKKYIARVAAVERAQYSWASPRYCSYPESGDVARPWRASPLRGRGHHSSLPPAAPMPCTAPTRGLGVSTPCHGWPLWRRFSRPSRGGPCGRPVPRRAPRALKRGEVIVKGVPC